MNLQFFNSLSKKVEPFFPLEEGKISMYVCGPTVYNYVHIGNMRPVVVFDTLRRFFEYIGFEVTYVSNYTDVDDKIIARALEEHTDEQSIARKYIAAFEQSLAGIHSRKPNIAPRVTEYMNQIISFIGKLIEADAAYEVDGDVFFRVQSDKNYGELSNVQVDDMLVGARVEENEKKESPLDFALWKKTKVGIKWPSPWGEGRPGWHTECVVMIDSIFPRRYIDIHGGGFDLKFPHHENEIAQSLAVNHNHLAHFWMHNGFINIDNEKMSKSLGNVVLAQDAIAKFGGNTLRMMLLSTHYRAPVNFTEEVVRSSRIEIDKIAQAYRQLAVYLQENNNFDDKKKSSHMDSFLAELANDLNTSNAITELFKVVKDANLALRQKVDIEQLQGYFSTMRDMIGILGFEIDYPRLNAEDKKLLSMYREAKQKKDFALSDQLRALLAQRHIL
jgi:cysteinyl-tRNA synthetase